MSKNLVMRSLNFLSLVLSLTFTGKAISYVVNGTPVNPLVFLMVCIVATCYITSTIVLNFSDKE